MDYKTIADIYSANQKIRERFVETVGAISAADASALPDGEKWTIQQIVEHISMVDSGVARICGKLLQDAKNDGKVCDGSVTVSAEFDKRSAEVVSVKIEAPERVQPTGNVTISESLANLKANNVAYENLRPGLEQTDLSGPTFPHPFFGDITAPEWLIMLGGHEMRHLKQIENLLEKIRR